MTMDTLPPELKSPSQAAHPVWERPDVHRWASIGCVYVSAVAMVVLAITTWTSVNATLKRSAEANLRQQQFNEGLVESIRDLAEQAGVLTSADFCPVRFRLRFPDGGLPAEGASGRLFSLTDDDPDRIMVRASQASGLIDFGLQPPGDYRLELTSAHGMTLEHEFEVLPGVPIERVVLCPNGPHPAQSPVNVEVIVDWPEQFSAHQLIALIEIRPGPFEEQGWCWRPSVDSPLAIAASNSLTQDLSEELIEEMCFSGELAGRATEEIYPAASVPVSYRYCEIWAVTFLLRSRDEASRVQVQSVGTVVFDSEGSGARVSEDDWSVPGSPPTYEADSNISNRWKFEIPQESVSELVERIREVNRTPNPTL